MCLRQSRRTTSSRRPAQSSASSWPGRRRLARPRIRVVAAAGRQHWQTAVTRQCSSLLSLTHSRHGRSASARRHPPQARGSTQRIGMIDEALAHHSHRLEATVRMCRKTRHRAAVVHAPAVLAGKVSTDVAASQAGPRPNCALPLGWRSSWCTQNITWSISFRGKPSGWMLRTVVVWGVGWCVRWCVGWVWVWVWAVLGMVASARGRSASCFRNWSLS